MRFLQFVVAFSLLLSSTACSKLSAAYYAARGDAYLDKGDYDRAIQDYNQAISRDPKLAHALAARGDAYLEKREYDKAIQDYNQAISRDPKDVHALAGRGQAYRDTGDYDRAIQDFNETLRLAPQAALTFNARGVAYFAKRDYDRALQDLNEAIRLRPKLQRAFRNRGIANMYAGHFTEAQQDFSQYFQMDPKDPYRAMWLYLARAKAGTDGKSELKTNTAAWDLSKWPGPVIQLYLDQSTPEDVLRAAGNDSDQNCEYSFYVGEYRALRGERPEALALFRSAREGCPEDFVQSVPAVIELTIFGEAEVDGQPSSQKAEP